MNHEWARTLRLILDEGVLVSPRGKNTYEIPQHTVTVPMRYPVLTIPGRKLSYKFMAAEAFWILSGDNTVAGIAPWNKNIADFSDDGKTFFGAYGPKIQDQINYVVRKLHEDPDTRQAGLTIWRENPPQTKDVPCTVAIFASIRRGRLNLSVYMRSSDVWLGLPYDTFTFSMLAHLICCRLNERPDNNGTVFPGTLYLTAASSHLYEDQWAQAEELAQTQVVTFPNQTPEAAFMEEEALMWRLKCLREAGPESALRWWNNQNET